MARDQSMIGDVFLWLHLLKQTEQIICSIAPLKDLFLQCFTIEIKSKCSRHSISNSSANIRRGRLLSGGTTGVRGGLSPINPACRFNFLGFFFLVKCLLDVFPHDSTKLSFCRRAQAAAVLQRRISKDEGACRISLFAQGLCVSLQAELL